MQFPLRHLSIRVPWHDQGWTGTVCHKPMLNSACLCLKNIGAKKKEEAEEAIKGQTIESLEERQDPPCVMERATFMAPFAFTKHHSHPYSTTSPNTHAHFAPSPLRFPAYSAPGVRFRWMQRDLVWGKQDERWPIRGLKKDYPLEHVVQSREPELPFNSAWMQDAENHKELLNCFWNHVREKWKGLLHIHHRVHPEHFFACFGPGSKAAAGEAFDAVFRFFCEGFRRI
jgi:hypothetical protein